MKANLQDQQTLLTLSELDLEKLRLETERKKLLAGDGLSQAQQLQLQLNEELIDSRNQVAELELELTRSESDLELVEKRLAKDKDQLASTSSAKDAQGIEHEIESLRKRQSDLEDVELEILERLELARATLLEAEKNKESALAQLAELEENQKTELERLAASISQVETEKQRLFATIDPALSSVYQTKSQRGSVAARLVGRDCGSCHLSLTATDFDEIAALAADELAQCPNCGVFLVRS